MYGGIRDEVPDRNVIRAVDDKVLIGEKHRCIIYMQTIRHSRDLNKWIQPEAIIDGSEDRVGRVIGERQTLGDSVSQTELYSVRFDPQNVESDA